MEAYKNIFLRDICLNILANVTGYVDFDAKALNNHLSILDFRRQSFCHFKELDTTDFLLEKGLKADSKIAYLNSREQKIRKHTKQYISFKTLDLWFVFSIFLVVIALFLSLITGYTNLCLLGSLPILALLLRCVSVEVSTKKHSIIINTLRNQLIPNEIKSKDDILHMTNDIITDNDEVVLTVVSLLHDHKLINILDENIYHPSFVKLNCIQSISLIQLSTYLTYYIREGKIAIRENCTNISLAKCLADNIVCQNGVKIDVKSFNVTFNRTLNADNTEYEKLVVKYITR